jgi:acyl-CoA dehydrogenase
MVDFSFSEEQRLFQNSMRKWCQKELPLEKIREMDSKGEIPREIIKGMADMNLLLMTVPQEHGGAETDWITASIAAEELGYADMSISVPVFFLVETSWGFVIDKYCSEQVREEVIRRAIKGDAFLGIASTESGGGSDVAAIKSTGRKEGNHWILNGEKTYISGTEEAKKMGGGYFLLARTSPPQPDASHKGITAFYLPINAEGIDISKRLEEMGRMAISTGSITMENVKVPDNHRLGEEGKGFYLTMEGFDNARLLIGATCIGASQRALEIGMQYIKERKAFGSPIGKFEGIQFDLADLWAELEALRSLVYRTAWMNEEKYRNKRFTPHEVSKYISAVKLKVPPFAFKVFEHVMLWLGAWGYTKECPLEMGLRGIMSYYIGAEGALNIQRIIIARELLGKEYIPYK